MEGLAEAFRTFKTSAFRLEFRPRYDVPDEREAFARYMRGEIGAIPVNSQWNEFVDEATKMGQLMSRLRIMPPRLSDYLRFEISCGYLWSSLRGEEICFLGREQLDVPGRLEDFWLFDDARALEMVYNDADRFIRSRPVEPSLVPLLVRAKVEWMGKAIPLRTIRGRMLRNEI